MKKGLAQFVLVTLFFLALTGCNSADKKGSKDDGSTMSSEKKDSKEDVSSVSTDEKASTEDAATTVSDKKGMTVKEAKAFLSADGANSGKEVTVSAYSWGINNRMGGEVQLNLGDKKLEGAQQANFSCIFSKEKSDVIKTIAKDAMVTVTGKIVKGSGGFELTDCKIGE